MSRSIISVHSKKKIASMNTVNLYFVCTVIRQSLLHSNFQRVILTPKWSYNFRFRITPFWGLFYLLNRTPNLGLTLNHSNPQVELFLLLILS